MVQTLKRGCKLFFLRMDGVFECVLTFSAFGMSADYYYFFMQKKSRDAFKHFSLGVKYYFDGEVSKCVFRKRK